MVLLAEQMVPCMGKLGPVQIVSEADTNLIFSDGLVVQVEDEDDKRVASTAHGFSRCGRETDRRVYETELFPGRRACEARSEMDDGSGALPRTADVLRGERRKGNKQVGPRRHSRDGSADRDRDRDKVEQGQKSS